jgi:diaminopropionate ammonia-lyase
MSRYWLNPAARSTRPSFGLFEPREYREVNRFFESRVDLRATPLHRLPGLASELGLGELLVKDESDRLGLNAFKILGVSYAVDRLLRDHRTRSPVAFTCATSGNHGRAVARVARERGISAKIYVPGYTLQARIRALTDERAEVIVVDGSYQDALRQMTADAERNGWTVISDVAHPGYEEIPRWIMLGYTWIMHEAERQWAPASPPDVLLVQGGVGGLVCAALSWSAYRYQTSRPYFISCEPTAAACILESAVAGRPVSLSTRSETIMSGLRSAEVSSSAWPTIAAAADAFVAIEDERSMAAMRRLALPLDGDPRVVAGPSGACGLAALMTILDGTAALSPVRNASKLGETSRVLVIATEGATDPDLHAKLTALT